MSIYSYTHPEQQTQVSDRHSHGSIDVWKLSWSHRLSITIQNLTACLELDQQLKVDDPTEKGPPSMIKL